MRLALGLLLALVVVAGLLVLADQLVTARAEDRLSERVSEELGAPAEAELRGWPLSWQLLRGRVSEVDVTARDVPIGGGDAAIEHLDVTLTDVEVHWRDVTDGMDGLPPARDAAFEARIDEATVQALLGLPEDLVGVELTDDLIVLNLAGLAEVEAVVEAADGIVVVRPQDGGLAGLAGIGEVPIDLSDQPGSPHVQEARVTPDAIVLSGVLEAVITAEGD